MTAHLHGSEPHWTEYGLIPPRRCRDCDTRIGHQHRDLCCKAICATCGDQALFCDCTEGEDDASVAAL